MLRAGLLFNSNFSMTLDSSIFKCDPIEIVRWRVASQDTSDIGSGRRRPGWLLAQPFSWDQVRSGARHDSKESLCRHAQQLDLSSAVSITKSKAWRHTTASRELLVERVLCSCLHLLLHQQSLSGQTTPQSPLRGRR